MNNSGRPAKGFVVVRESKSQQRVINPVGGTTFRIHRRRFPRFLELVRIRPWDSVRAVWGRLFRGSVGYSFRVYRHKNLDAWLKIAISVLWSLSCFVFSSLVTSPVGWAQTSNTLIVHRSPLQIIFKKMFSIRNNEWRYYCTKVSKSWPIIRNETSRSVNQLNCSLWLWFVVCSLGVFPPHSDLKIENWCYVFTKSSIT